MTHSRGARGQGTRVVAAARSALPSPFDAMRLSLAALIIVAIGRVQEVWTFLMPLRPALLTVALATACVVLRPGSTARNGVLRTWPSRVVMAIAALSLLSAVFGISLGQSASFIINNYSRVIACWLLVVIGMRDARDYALMVWSYLIGVAFQVYIAIFVLKAESCHGCAAARLNDGNAYMYDANDMGVLMITAIPLLLLQFERSRLLGRIACVTLILGIGWATALAGSRGAMLGLVGTGAALLVLARQVSVTKRVLAVVVVGASLAVAAPAGYWDQMGKILQPKNDYNWDSEDGRVKIWTRGAGYMVAYPLFGVGINNYGRAEGTISDKARYHAPGTALVFTAPHNSFLQAGAELGVPGLLLWASLSIGGCVAMLRLRRRLPREWEHGTPDERYLYLAPMYMAVAFVGFIVTSFFLSFAWLVPIYLLSAFSATILAQTAERLPAAGRQPHRTRAVVSARWAR